MITIEQIAKIVKRGWGVNHKNSRAKDLLPDLNDCFGYYEFGPEEVVLFLGNCIWECGFFHRITEQYVAPGYDRPGDQYEGRTSLGNAQKGDGHKFIGRGMINITGRKNYQSFADFIDDQNIMDNPSLVASNSTYAVETAFQYWLEYMAEDTDRTCEDVAMDTSLSLKDRCLRVSGIINRGEEESKKKPNHMRQRYLYTKKTADALGVVSW